MLSKQARRSHVVVIATLLCVVYAIFSIATRHGAQTTALSRNALDQVKSRLYSASGKTGRDQSKQEADTESDPDASETLQAILSAADDEEGGDTEDLTKEERLEQWAANTFADVDVDDTDGEDYTPLAEGKDYREIFSLTSRDRGFIGIFTGGAGIYNPNVIPHPTRYDLWIVTGQRQGTGFMTEQMVCTAGFFNGALTCSAEPVHLPVEGSITGQCPGEFAYLNMRPGPRDFRLFHGATAVYMTYGSQSLHTCLGVWLQDARMVLDEYVLEKDILTQFFKSPTEIQRPTPAQAIEKDYFIFFDADGKPYVHHDLYPRRVFASPDFDGSVGEDLAPAAENQDAICMARYMPALGPDDESIHQATNSLAITLCNRGECTPTENNTYIMTIFHHKSHFDYHSIYEPYVMLFEQKAPFAMHAISQRPLWIHGRGPLTKGSHAATKDALQASEDDPTTEPPKIFTITSMSWKTHGQRYHGFLDDPVFLAFGIEDSRAAIMDVTAADLVGDMGFCN